MFYVTHSHYVQGINMLLKFEDPELWKLIRKGFYPTLMEKLLTFLAVK
jgi:hypothetical protein